jgi:Atypical Arm repeat
VVHVLANGPFSELQKEAVWAVLVATDGKENEAQALQLLRLGVVPPVVRLLNAAEADNKAMAIAVDALDNVLKAAKHAKTADDQGAAVAAVRGCGGVEALKKMQNHANVDISQKATAVLASHFS